VRAAGVYERTTAVLSGVLVLIGAAVFVETALVGGGVGFLLGALLVLVGSVRLYLSRK
jgi:hypothetical protein